VLGSQTEENSQSLPVWVEMENMMQQAAIAERYEWFST